MVRMNNSSLTLQGTNRFRLIDTQITHTEKSCKTSFNKGIQTLWIKLWKICKTLYKYSV